MQIGSVEALLGISRRSDVPIATGEELFDLAGFEPLIQARACACLQPDRHRPLF